MSLESRGVPNEEIARSAPLYLHRALIRPLQLQPHCAIQLCQNGIYSDVNLASAWNKYFILILSQV